MCVLKSKGAGLIACYALILFYYLRTRIRGFFVCRARPDGGVRKRAARNAWRRGRGGARATQACNTRSRAFYN